MAALEALADILGLPGLPGWIVCVDASSHHGSNPVAALVSFRDGLPDRSGYRRYSMPPELGGNDPGMIGSAVGRFARNLEGPAPDLFLVDGGLTQLRAAWKSGSGPMPGTLFASLAKREEQVLIAPSEKTVSLPRDSPPILVLRGIRDEAHRFVIHYHRNRSLKDLTHSLLDEVPGIGPSLKAALLREFGSVERLAAAKEEALCSVPGVGREKARRIRRALSENP